MPSPVTGLPESIVVVAAGSSESGVEQADSRTAAQVNSVESSTRGDNMAFPFLSLLVGSTVKDRKFYRDWGLFFFGIVP